MTTTNHIVSRQQATAIADELMQAIKDVMAKHNMEVKPPKIQFGDCFTMKIEATPVQEGLNGVNLNSMEATYYQRFGFNGFNEKTGQMIPLTAELGTTFMNCNDEFIFSGVNAKRRKYPICAIRKRDGVHLGFAEGVIPTINSASKAS